MNNISQNKIACENIPNYRAHTVSDFRRVTHSLLLRGVHEAQHQSHRSTKSKSELYRLWDLRLQDTIDDLPVMFDQSGNVICYHRARLQDDIAIVRRLNHIDQAEITAQLNAIENRLNGPCFHRLRYGAMI